ncbi:MAG TPA: preprotein translocase subunit YajC [Elusimicrobia bacterium]|nr:MAG: preprotein translocase subunit YajC [Elusimicrobia bacterium RIFOXYA12_FULL_49_49]OGS09412.1 MAG: preprotein translocase subunit YajC [Elusimicrobia bacterium RIFOXYA1_FULL_47_7]OGS09651.1 MAG: preprotein translocase subunit YajC [Elusimicrobia bacterium RIFOXYB1_FULL_48_9]OGS15538.1 MAG: preprotein translocase subunit YajC [Elusimicrobia bacterium RIFOXYA2_FULL_47_53]OGS26906.1 MAG: preprotein translocase subunit YajC [Elusimicrobia bacterium RIFOXYB12_FULL_50_12]OGS30637.1 MAG: prepr
MKNQIVLAASLLIPAGLFAEGSPAGGAGGMFGGFFPLIVIFFIFYFMLIRPQQKKAKEHQNILNALKKDDKVITSAGIYATVVSVNNNIVEVKIAEGVKIQIEKSAVTTVINKDKESKEATVVPEIIKK